MRSAWSLACLVTSLVSGVGAAACAPKSPVEARCPAGRTMLDGVCASEQVADYVACVRAQGAKLGQEQGKKLAAEAGVAGTRAQVVSEVSEKLEKQYSASEAGTLEIIRACGDFRAAPGRSAACIEAGKLGVSCGFDPDPSWSSRCAAGAVVSCLTMRGPTCEGIALCGFEEGTRASCGAAVTPSGTAGCAATLDCYHACKGDKACECKCTSAMAPQAALAVGIVGQCYELQCRDCGDKGRGECDVCFRKSCQQKYDTVCKLH